MALGGGFLPDELFDEVRTTHAFRDLTRAEWAWVLDFITHGGDALRAYPEYSKVVVEDGRLRGHQPLVAMRHRLSIGTIVSETLDEGSVPPRRTLGSVEENFIARLRPGDHFTFAGRTLEFVRVRGLMAYVRKSTRKTPSCRIGPAPACRSRRSWPPASGPSSTRRGGASTPDPR